MKKKQLHRLFSVIMAFAMVFTLALPMNVSANDSVKPFKQNGTDESTMLAKAAVAQQLNLLAGESALHKDLQGLSESEEVAVIVHLSEKPVALEKGIKELAGKKFTSSDANAVKSKVKAQHSFFKKELNANNISFTEGFSYDTVLNGFSMTVKAADLEKILNIKGVTLIEPDVTVYAMEESAELAKVGQVGPAMDTSIGFLGIEALWAEGYEGQGIKVAVLDTGIDADHPDFQGIYKGGKNFVPHTGTSYARPRADDDASETSPLDRPSNRPEFDADGRAFYTSHGTHVAGTIAAIGNNEYGIKGIAPKVDLFAYRVLGAYGSGSTSGIIAAIDTAVIEGMDVINLSLGGGSNTETDSGSFAINNAMLAGTISVIATGNSGPNRGTMGTPGTARLGIAVGNTTNPEAHYFGDININAGDYNLTKQLNLMGTTYGTDLAAQLDGEYSLVAVPGLGKPTDYAGLDVDGKVALVSRGEIAFVDKIAAAKENGAIAIIVHNFAGGTNAPGPSGTFLGDDFEFIPTFDMSQTDGDAIRAALAQAEGTISFGNFDKTMTTGDEVNSSSSRGPSTPNFDIKPDVTAPGTNIMSTIPMYKADFPEATYEKAFTRKTGTSMATPHIAGIAALVKQANPDWNAFDVKVALSNTAKVLDTGKYDVFAQGAGRVNAYAAAHPEILAYAIDEAVRDAKGEIVENLKGTVTFGPQDLKKEDITVKKQILVKDIAGNGGDYTVAVNYTKTFGDAKITVDQPQFTLAGEMLLTVTLTASQATTKSGDELLGYIHIGKGGDLVEKTSLSVNKTTLTLNTGGKEQLTVKENVTEDVEERVEVSLPFAADFGGKAATEIRDMSITETDLSFNGDGVKDEAMLRFTLTGPVTTNYIELWDMMDPEGGEYGDGYIGYLHAGSSLGAGSWQLPVRGQYTPWDGSGATLIPDGLYTIDFTALSASGVIGDFVGPVVVKSSAGTIDGAVEDTTVTGQVDDAYIAYQEELEWYELGYDINTKLKASYEVLNGEEVVSSGPISLEQDGAFTFELPELNKQENSVKVKYEDAAGNKAEKVIFTPVALTEEVIETIEPGTTEEPIEKETPENPGLPKDSEKQIEPVKAESVSNLVQIASFDNSKSVQSNEKIIDGPAKTDALEGKDVTKEATYKVADESIVTVEKGLVTAKKAGTTKITVTYGDNEPVVVTVTVKDPVVVNPTPNPSPQPPVVKEEKPGEEKPTLPVFTDIANTFAAKEINALVAKGIIQGKSETEFAPNAQITRAEFAVLLARALELPLEEYEGIFGDVDTSKKWAFAGVEAAARAGIVNGTSDGKFNPDAPIKREEIAAMIIRSIEFKNKEKLADLDTPANFDDHGSIGTFAIDSVYKATALGVIKGNEGNFLPKNNATRAEAAVMLYRALDVLELLD